MSFDPKYNINWEFCECVEDLYEIFDWLDDIKIVLNRRRDIISFLHSSFDPFKTIGKTLTTMPSSSPHASSSRRRVPTPVPNTVPTNFTASELSRLILDNSSVDLINQTKPDVAYAAHLRHVSYVALTTKRLEQELDRHYQENQELFEHLWKDEVFQKMMSPVIRNYRQ